MVGLTGRHVRNGEQLCISYFNEFQEVLNLEQRTDKLNGWNIQCRCERCTNQPQITEADIPDEPATSNILYGLEEELNRTQEWNFDRGINRFRYMRYLAGLVDERNFLKY